MEPSGHRAIGSSGHRGIGAAHIRFPGPAAARPHGSPLAAPLAMSAPARPGPAEPSPAPLGLAPGPATHPTPIGVNAHPPIDPSAARRSGHFLQPGIGSVSTMFHLSIAVGDSRYLCKTRTQRLSPHACCPYHPLPATPPPPRAPPPPAPHPKISGRARSVPLPTNYTLLSTVDSDGSGESCAYVSDADNDWACRLPHASESRQRCLIGGQVRERGTVVGAGARGRGKAPRGKRPGHRESVPRSVGGMSHLRALRWLRISEESPA
jgi:hypothetical protein